MDYPKISIVVPVRAFGSSDIVIDSLKKTDYPKELIETFVIEGQNPSYQRNEAIKKASGEIIFFFDDDSEVDPQLLKETIATYQKYPEVIGVGGPACLYGNTYFQKANIVILTSLLGVYKIRSRYSPVGKLRYTNENELISCNLSIKREVFDKEQGFNERLYPNEENELIHRLIKNGYKFIYNPDCKVYRRTDDSVGVFLRRIFSYGRGRMRQLFVGPSPISLLRLTPLFFLLYLFILVLSLNHYLLIPFFLYLAVVVIFSIYNSRDRLEIIPMVFILYVFTHIAYGLGEAHGIVKIFGIKRKR